MHGEGRYAWDTENPRGIYYIALYIAYSALYSTLILDVLFYAKKITSIQNKRSPKTDTMCIILINTRFTATL